MDEHLQRSLHARHGGVHFTQLRPVREINQFVAGLPSDTRDSLFDVMHALDQAGYIRIENDGDILDAEGEMHPD